MIAAPDSLFALPEPTALLRSELAGVPEQAAARPAGRALLVQACAVHRELAVDTGHLGLVRLCASAGALTGDLNCAADALPFENDAFQLIVAQHVADVLPASQQQLVAEFARVLVPGGRLLWFGLNPWSPWLAWLHWQARGGMSAPGVAGSESVRRRLLASGLQAGTARLIGSCWPSRHDRDGAISPLRAAWALAADKRQNVLTPLRARWQRERIPARPSLAVPSRRNCG